MAKKIAAVVLAAGDATCKGQPKLTLSIEDQPLIRRVVEAVARARVDDTIVVVGAHQEVVTAAVQGTPARIVANPDHARGLGTSIRLGIESAPEDTEAYLLVPGDLALLDAATLDSLIQRFESGPEGIVVPEYQRVPASVMILDRRYRDQLLNLEDEDDALRVLLENPQDVHDHHMSTDGVVFDIDDEEDYEDLLRRLGLPLPSEENPITSDLS
jgi:molybdenum cofactor cytidylyltransferase